MNEVRRWLTLSFAVGNERTETGSRNYKPKSSDKDAVTFYVCVSVHRSIGQIKHQLDATLCRFYFCRVTLHVSGVRRPSSGVLKSWHGTVGHHITILGTKLLFVPNVVMWWPTCNYNTCTRGRRASFLILLLMGAWRPKHVEWLCRNKTCTVLHQVGVLFDQVTSSCSLSLFICSLWKSWKFGVL